MKLTIEIDSWLAGQAKRACWDTHSDALHDLARIIESAEREAIVARATRNSLVSPPLPRLDEASTQTGER